jgi:23S rRNA pseudouridine1911/1915/1917 synthase
VHLAFIGFPIVNDTLYGRRQRQFEVPGHALHAARLCFKRPADNQLLTLEAELPLPWQAVLAQLA